MTYLNQLMRARRLTKAELSRKSGIPETLDYHIKCNTAPKKERHCVRFVLE